MAGRTKGERATSARRPTTKRTLTKGHQVRLAAMNAASPVVTQAELCKLLEERGAQLNRSTVGFILRGDWYNEDVAQALADTTGQQKAVLWPEFLDMKGNRFEAATMPSGNGTPAKAVAK